MVETLTERGGKNISSGGIKTVILMRKPPVIIGVVRTRQQRREDLEEPATPPSRFIYS